jgi:hypothetical protein
MSASTHPLDLAEKQLSALPATRKARAEYLLATLDREDGKVSYRLLDQRLVRHHRLDDDNLWSVAQLDKAIDDLASAGLIGVTPGGAGGNLRVQRLGEPGEKEAAA